MVFRKLSIRGFRRFEHFELDDLARVNLLVGKNGCGKTTILEAVDLLCGQPDDAPLSRMTIRRGETVPAKGQEAAEMPAGLHLDIRRLFHDDPFVSSGSFQVTGTRQRGNKGRTVVGRIFKDPPQTANGEGAAPRRRKLDLTWNENGAESTFLLHLSTRGSAAVAETSISSQSDLGTPLGWIPTRFVEPMATMPRQVVSMYSNIALTPSEDTIIEALRIIEPAIERIAVVAPEDAGLGPALRGGIMVRCRGREDRIPIGSMGDGIWHILALSLALSAASGGVLLVDEIDTGLHYSVMADMWRVMCRAAARLNVQVLATTHSSDCWTALASIVRDGDGDTPDVAVHRIEDGVDRAIRFSAEEMVAAAERGLEVR